MGTTNLDALSLDSTLTVAGAQTASAKLTLQTATAGLLAGAGTSGANHSLGATAGNALEFYLNATHTTGDMRGQYLRLYFSGAGGSGEAARIFSTINNVSVATGGTVNGAHISLGTAGASAAVSGAANALRATFGIAAATTTARAAPSRSSAGATTSLLPCNAPSAMPAWRPAIRLPRTTTLQTPPASAPGR